MSAKNAGSKVLQWAPEEGAFVSRWAVGSEQSAVLKVVSGVNVHGPGGHSDPGRRHFHSSLQQLVVEKRHDFINH